MLASLTVLHTISTIKAQLIYRQGLRKEQWTMELQELRDPRCLGKMWSLAMSDLGNIEPKL
jgi:hypothetical protein